MYIYEVYTTHDALVMNRTTGYLESHGARLDVPHEANTVELRAPHLHLPLPVVRGGQGTDDEHGPIFRRGPLVEDAADEGEGLDGLAEPHLVREDDVGVGPPAVVWFGLVWLVLDTEMPRRVF